MPYTVRVADMFQYMDPDHEYDLGPFATLAEAERAARELVDRNLEHLARAGMTAEELVSQWYGFGLDPYIIPAEGCERATFYANDYVKERAPAVAGRQSDP